MKFKLHQASLRTALDSVQGIVSARAALPILSNVLIEAQGETLTFTTTDFDLTMRFTCPAEIEEEGAVTLPMKRLSAIVHELPDNIVAISTTAKNPDVAALRCASYRSSIKGLPAKDFPPVPMTDDGVSYTLRQGALKEMLKKTSYAAATDDSRPILKGVLLSFDEGRLTCVATDSRRLALFWSEVEFPPENKREVVLDMRAVNELMRSLEDDGDATAKITIKDTQIIVEYGSRYFCAKLKDGAYPPYRQVVFNSCDNKIVVNREELLSVLRRINVSTTPTTNAMLFRFVDNTLAISVKSVDVEEADESLNIKYEGPQIDAVFNPEYMMAPLRCLTSDEVTIELNNGSSPGLIKDDSSFLYVIMPLRV